MVLLSRMKDILGIIRTEVNQMKYNKNRIIISLLVLLLTVFSGSIRSKLKKEPITTTSLKKILILPAFLMGKW